MADLLPLASSAAASSSTRATGRPRARRCSTTSERWTYTVDRRDRREPILQRRLPSRAPTPAGGSIVGDKFSQRVGPAQPEGTARRTSSRSSATRWSSPRARGSAPLAFQAEGPFLAAVYQSLTGVDAYYWFTLDDVEYKTEPLLPLPAGQGPEAAASSGRPRSPPILGGFPGDALAVPQGLRQARRARGPRGTDPPHRSGIARRRSIAEDPSFDPNRDQGNKPKAPAAGREGQRRRPPRLPRRAGRGQVRRRPLPKTRVADLSRYIDHDKKLVRSITGEVTLDYNVGLCTVDTRPRRKGPAASSSQRRA